MENADKKYNLHELFQNNAEDVVAALKLQNRKIDEAALEKSAQKVISYIFVRSAEDSFKRKMRFGGVFENTGKAVAMVSFPLLVVFPDIALLAAFAVGALTIAGGQKYRLMAFEKRNALVMPTYIGFSSADKGDKKIFREATDMIDTWKADPSGLFLG